MLRRVGTMMASAVGLGCCPAQATAPDAGYNPINTQMGNYLQIGLPVLGLGLTYLFTSGKVDGASFFGAGFEDGGRGPLDWNRLNGSPRHDFALAFGRMEVVTCGLKYSIDEQRPNGAPHSFPSGHTSASFMGAAASGEASNPRYRSDVVPAFTLHLGF